MAMIKLHEYSYKNGGYCTYPLFITKEEISSVRDVDGGYSVDFCEIITKNGSKFRVQETATDVFNKISAEDE